jgi:polysaccharide biosynthesis/export protein
MTNEGWSFHGVWNVRKHGFVGLLFLLFAVFAAGLAQARSGRVLNTNDVLQINVLNQTELNATARIEPDGTISLPYTGPIRASGLTTEDLSVKIANLLVRKGLVKNPEVSVELSTFGTQVSVLGWVNTPGAYTLDRPTSLLQVIARAGGIKEGVGVSTIVVHSRGRVRRFDARSLLEGREVGMMVSNNDTVYVDQGAVYYLYGYVNKPGQYPISRQGMNVREAIAAGGGVAQLGSDWWRLKIRRTVNGVSEEVSANLDDIVRPDDTIVVNERLF